MVAKAGSHRILLKILNSEYIVASQDDDRTYVKS